MNKSNWKGHERRIANALGVRRNGPTGLATADVETDWLCVEAKSWKGGVKKVEAALEQSERAAKDGQLPIAVIHTPNRRSTNDLVVMRWGEFLEYFGGADGNPTESV